MHVRDQRFSIAYYADMPSPYHMEFSRQASCKKQLLFAYLEESRLAVYEFNCAQYSDHIVTKFGHVFCQSQRTELLALLTNFIVP